MKTYLSVIAALVTFAALAGMAVIIAPFAKPLAWALMIGIATIPHYRRLAGRMPRHPNSAAVLMVILMALFLVLPLTLLIVVLVDNAGVFLREIQHLLTSLAVAKKTFLAQAPMVNRLMTQVDRIGIDVTGYVARGTATTAQRLLDAATNVAINLAQLLYIFGLTLFILFFIYRDGEAVVAAAVARFAPDREKMRYYLAEIRSTTTAVIVGNLFTCFLQGAFAGVAYYAADIAMPVLAGAVTAVAGLVPVVGTAVVWVPLALMLVFQGAYLKAVLLSVWCLIVVIAITDNVIRPLAVGAKSNVPTLAVVLGAIGGVVTMGVLGLILGPIVFGIVVTVWRDLTGSAPDGGTSA